MHHPTTMEHSVAKASRYLAKYRLSLLNQSWFIWAVEELVLGAVNFDDVFVFTLWPCGAMRSHAEPCGAMRSHAEPQRAPMGEPCLANLNQSIYMVNETFLVVAQSPNPQIQEYTIL